MRKKSFSNEEECQYAIKAVNRQLNTHTHSGKRMAKRRKACFDFSTTAALDF